MGDYLEPSKGPVEKTVKGNTVPADKPELRLTVRFKDGDAGEFRIPAYGGNRPGISFHWNIKWGDGAYGCSSGVSSLWGGDIFSGSLTHHFSTPGIYSIVLSPVEKVVETVGETPGWLQAFGYSADGLMAVEDENGVKRLSNISGRDNLIKVDGIIDDCAINVGHNQACAEMFAGCRNVTMGSSFSISSKKEQAGDFFCYKMFENCCGEAFTMGESFQLPQNLCIVGRAFCCRMFEGCCGPSFTMNDSFTIPQKIIHAGDSFCTQMFYEFGPQFTMGRAFNLPQEMKEANSDFCSYMFSSGGKFDSCFDMNEIFNLPQGIRGRVGHDFCVGMFAGNEGPRFSMNARFNIPAGITGAGDKFCKKMFNFCSGESFTMNNVFNLPQKLGQVGEECCMWMFNWCNGKQFKVNEIFKFPSSVIGPPPLAFEMFALCDWEALNWNIQDIVRCNLEYRIWVGGPYS